MSKRRAIENDLLSGTLEKLRLENVQLNLVRAALFLAGWEMLCSEIIAKTGEFFLTGFDTNGFTYSADRPPETLAGSLNWLVEMEALDACQAERVQEIRRVRNEIAHELPRLLVDAEREVDLEKLTWMNEILSTIGRFFGRIEVETSGDLDPETIDFESIKSGAMLLMEHLLCLESVLSQAVRESRSRE